MTATATRDDVVELLDKASNAAWDSCSPVAAISNAQAVLRTHPAAMAAWRAAVGYDGSDDGFMAFMKDRFRDRGAVGISLTKAALITEQTAEPARGRPRYRQDVHEVATDAAPEGIILQPRERAA